MHAKISLLNINPIVLILKPYIIIKMISTFGVVSHQPQVASLSKTEMKHRKLRVGALHNRSWGPITIEI
jgi:hypothetical protein